MHLKQIWDLIRESLGRRWTITPRAWAQLDDYAPSLGAALVYYTLFSIAPVLTQLSLFEG